MRLRHLEAGLCGAVLEGLLLVREYSGSTSAAWMGLLRPAPAILRVHVWVDPGGAAEARTWGRISLVLPRLILPPSWPLSAPSSTSFLPLSAPICPILPTYPHHWPNSSGSGTHKMANGSTLCMPRTTILWQWNIAPLPSPTTPTIPCTGPILFRIRL